MEKSKVSAALKARGYSVEMIKHFFIVMNSNDYDFFEFDNDLKDVREVVLWCIEKNWSLLSKVSVEFKDDKEVVFSAVKENGAILCFASDNMKDDKEIVLAAVKNSGVVLGQVSDRLRGDKGVVLAAVGSYGGALKFASDELRCDKEIVMVSVNENGHSLCYAGEELANDKDVVMSAVKSSYRALKYSSEKMCDDFDIALSAVSGVHFMALEFVSNRLKNVPEIIFAALLASKSSGLVEKMFEYASDEIKSMVGAQDPLEVLRIIVENNKLSNAIEVSNNICLKKKI